MLEPEAARPRVEPIRFSSKSEAVLAMLMEKYIPEWEAIPGQTTAVKVGVKIFDFRVDNVLIEYHPIVLEWEFKNKAAYHGFRAALRRCPISERKNISKALENEFFAQYYKRRWDIVRSNPAFKDCDVFCARDVGEFFEGVIDRFGKNTPKLRDFEAEFEGQFKRLR